MIDKSATLILLSGVVTTYGQCLDVGQLGQIGLNDLHIQIVGNVDEGRAAGDNPPLLREKGKITISPILQ